MGWRNSPFCPALSLRWCCQFHPISLVLPKETGWSPKEKRLWGGGAPVRFRDPPASPTRVGGATRPLRCPLRGRIESLAPRARGLGWQKSSQVKVFCPAFLQKSGRGPGAAPLGVSLCFKSAGGGQRGNPRRGFPLCGRPRRPQPMRAAVGRAVDVRRAGFHPRPDAGGPLTPCHRNRPVGDGVLDVPPSRFLPAPPRSARPGPGVG